MCFEIHGKYLLLQIFGGNKNWYYLCTDKVTKKVSDMQMLTDKPIQET